MFSEFLKRYRFLFVVFLIGIVTSCDNAQNHVDLADKLILDNKCPDVYGPLNLSGLFQLLWYRY